METFIVVLIALVTIGIVFALLRVTSKRHQEKQRAKAERELEVDYFYRTLSASNRTYSTHDARRNPVADPTRITGQAQHPMVGIIDEVESQTFAETNVYYDATRPVNRQGAYPEPIGDTDVFGDSYHNGYSSGISKDYGDTGTSHLDSGSSYSSSSSSDSSSSYSTPSYDSGSSSSSSFDSNF